MISPLSIFMSLYFVRSCYYIHMNKIKILCFVLLIAFGGFMVGYGGMDDSPGGQLLGILAIIIGGVCIFKTLRGNMS